MLRLPGPYLGHSKPRIGLWAIPKQDADHNGLDFTDHTAGTRVHRLPTEDIQDGLPGFRGPGHDCRPRRYQFCVA